MTPDHIVDAEHRLRLLRQLRNIRCANGMTLRDVGDDLHVTFGAVSAFERHHNPRVGTAQRYARALGHRVDIRILRIPGTTPAPFGLGDAEAVEHCRSELAAARQRLGLSLRDVARRMQVSRHAVRLFEIESRDPYLSTLQERTRALGGRLMYRVVAAPAVDGVKLEQVNDGRLRFGSLTAAEQVEMVRRYGGVDNRRTLVYRWGVSGSRLAEVAALAGVAA